MNSQHAQSLGIRYADEPVQTVSTAAGRLQARPVTLTRVSLGDIEIHAVAATILEGNFPEAILLGNIFYPGWRRIIKLLS